MNLLIRIYVHFAVNLIIANIILEKGVGVSGNLSHWRKIIIISKYRHEYR